MLVRGVRDFVLDACGVVGVCVCVQVLHRPARGAAARAAVPAGADVVRSALGHHPAHGQVRADMDRQVVNQARCAPRRNAVVSEDACVATPPPAGSDGARPPLSRTVSCSGFHGRSRRASLQGRAGSSGGRGGGRRRRPNEWPFFPSASASRRACDVADRGVCHAAHLRRRGGVRARRLADSSTAVQ